MELSIAPPHVWETQTEHGAESVRSASRLFLVFGHAHVKQIIVITKGFPILSFDCDALRYLVKGTFVIFSALHQYGEFRRHTKNYHKQQPKRWDHAESLYSLDARDDFETLPIIPHMISMALARVCSS